MAAAGPELPVYVYNNVSFQGYLMELPLIRRLKEEAGVSGIKDATFDIMAHANYIRTLRTNGLTSPPAQRPCGCSHVCWVPGVHSGLGNAFPEICKKMWTEGMEGRYEECRKTQFMINEVRDIMYLARSTQLAIYAMLEIAGILTIYPRSPFIPATAEEKGKIKARLTQLGLL